MYCMLSPAYILFLSLKMFYLLLQHAEEIYDPEIYRHQIAEYYNPYVLDADIQAGEFLLVLCFFKFFHVIALINNSEFFLN